MTGRLLALELDTTLVTPAGKASVMRSVAPGATAVFASTSSGTALSGLASAPIDRVAVRLLERTGSERRGVAIPWRLRAGHYLIEARLPATRRQLWCSRRWWHHAASERPPAEVAGKYRELVGMSRRRIERPDEGVMRLGVIRLAAALLSAAASTATAASGPATVAALDQVQRADAARVVPERFLRRWDPVTVFLDRDAGPVAGGPEDQPEKYVTLVPAQAGAWQWLGPRVLQFRPAEPWRPLRRVVVARRAGHTLCRCCGPGRNSPADEPNGIVELDAVSLTFMTGRRAGLAATTIELRRSQAPLAKPTADSPGLYDQALERHAADRQTAVTCTARRRTAMRDPQIATFR
jgi:hypothetical protein